MIINLENKNIVFWEEFPKNPFELADILDRLHQPENRKVRFRFEHFPMKYPVPPELHESEFYADISLINLFAERFEKLTPEENAVYQAVLRMNRVIYFEDAVQMLYGLETVPAVKASSLAELGAYALEHGLLPEFENCPEEFRKYLDTAKIGRLMDERTGGIFIDGYYCDTYKYQKPEISVEFQKPEQEFFRLLLTENPDDKINAQWYTLPCDESELNGKICLENQSALPNLRISQRPEREEILYLNRLAVRLSELNPHEFIKLKAVMEYERACNIAGTYDCISRLNEYDFDPLPTDRNEFGRKYLAQNMTENFSPEVLENSDLSDFGSEIIRRKQGRFTSYGVISGRGQELYSGIISEPEQEETEDCELQMGGMCH